MKREDIIEKMAKAICLAENKNPDTESHVSLDGSIGYEWGWFTHQAEAALDTFLERLPETPLETRANGAVVIFSADGIYQQILAMRKTNEGN